MSPAFWSTEKWADMVGLETAKWSDNSPADIGRLRSSCSTRRRVGSERALNTLFKSLYLANHRTIVKRQFRSTGKPRNGAAPETSKRITLRAAPLIDPAYPSRKKSVTPYRPFFFLDTRKGRA